MIPKKSLGIIIGGGVAAVLIIVVVLGQTGFLKNIEAGMPEQKTPVIQEHSPFSAYKINTECELIYGFASGKYPDDQKIPPIKTSEIFTKYPDDFAPWKQILENNDTRVEFFKKPLPANFTDALVTVIMKETSINPDLKSIVSLIADPQGKAKLQGAYEQYNCKPYFDQRSKQ